MDLQLVARQLQKPEGDFGKVVGEKMSISNAFLIRYTLELLNTAPQDHILEIGMGNGFFCQEILQPNPGVQYTGCDFSELMVQEATQVNQPWVDLGRARFLLADAAQLPLADQSFNKVFTVNTIYFWKNPDQTLTSLRRVLKPGGSLLISLRTPGTLQQLPFTPYGFRAYQADELGELLKRNGFTVPCIHPFSEPDQEFNGVTIRMNSMVAVCARED